MVSETSADILLCDIAMPEHDGLWLAEQVHERWPGTAIIMSTAGDNRGDAIGGNHDPDGGGHAP